jgi:hypothetical protein
MNERQGEKGYIRVFGRSVAPVTSYKALGAGGFVGSSDEVPLCSRCGGVVHDDCGDDGVDVVLLECFGKLLHVRVVHGEDLGDVLALKDLLYRSVYMLWVMMWKGERTLRVITMTSCVPSARKASTIVWPTEPVPPMTATVTILYDVY